MQDILRPRIWPLDERGDTRITAVEIFVNDFRNTILVSFCSDPRISASIRGKFGS
jgi:hypothetical protein